jgi:DNA-binding transcriptional MerR regulator
MPVLISGQNYSTKDEVAKDLGINPVTLWRWRKKGAIPTGLRSRNRQVLFSPDEVTQILEYANKLEPIELGGIRQLGLFPKTTRKGKE